MSETRVETLADPYAEEPCAVLAGTATRRSKRSKLQRTPRLRGVLRSIPKKPRLTLPAAGLTIPLEKSKTTRTRQSKLRRSTSLLKHGSSCDDPILLCEDEPATPSTPTLGKRNPKRMWSAHICGKKIKLSTDAEALILHVSPIGKTRRRINSPKAVLRIPYRDIQSADIRNMPVKTRECGLRVQLRKLVEPQGTTSDRQLLVQFLRRQQPSEAGDSSSDLIVDIRLADYKSFFQLPGLERLIKRGHGTGKKHRAKGNRSRKERAAARKTLLVYPSRGNNSVVLTPSDLGLLRAGEYLNDSVIEFYLKFVHRQATLQGRPHQAVLRNRERFHFFSTFFLTRLLNVAPGEQGYTHVKKWTASVDIFSKDFLLIPINDSHHWSLAIVCYPGRTPQRRPPTPKQSSKAPSVSRASSTPRRPVAKDARPNIDNEDDNGRAAHDGDATIESVRESDEGGACDKAESNKGTTVGGGKRVSKSTCNKQEEKASKHEDNWEEDREWPCILFLDSLFRHQKIHENAIFSYLDAEWRNRKPHQQVPAFKCYPVYEVVVPKQTNSCDCGVFLLHYALRFVLEPWRCLWNMNPKSKRDEAETMRARYRKWFKPKEMIQKRRDIYNMIGHLRSGDLDDEWQVTFLPQTNFQYSKKNYLASVRAPLDDLSGQQSQEQQQEQQSQAHEAEGHVAGKDNDDVGGTANDVGGVDNDDQDDRGADSDESTGEAVRTDHQTISSSESSDSGESTDPQTTFSPRQHRPPSPLPLSSPSPTLSPFRPGARATPMSVSNATFPPPPPVGACARYAAHYLSPTSNRSATLFDRANNDAESVHSTLRLPPTPEGETRADPPISSNVDAWNIVKRVRVSRKRRFNNVTHRSGSSGGEEADAVAVAASGAEEAGAVAAAAASAAVTTTFTETKRTADQTAEVFPAPVPIPCSALS